MDFQARNVDVRDLKDVADTACSSAAILTNRGSDSHSIVAKSSARVHGAHRSQRCLKIPSVDVLRARKVHCMLVGSVPDLMHLIVLRPQESYYVCD